MGEGNRVVLPAPLIGYHETHRHNTLKLWPTTIRADQIEDYAIGLAKVAAGVYPPGDNDIEVLVGQQAHHVTVREHVTVTLDVQIEPDQPLTLLDTLIRRLQETADEIHVPGAAWGHTLEEPLRERGFERRFVPFAADAEPGPAGSTPETEGGFVWYKGVA